MPSVFLFFAALISLCYSPHSYAAHEADPSAHPAAAQAKNLATGESADHNSTCFAEIYAWLSPEKKKLHIARKHYVKKIKQEQASFSAEKEKTILRNKELGTPQVEIDRKVKNLERQFKQTKEYWLLEQQIYEDRLVKSILEFCISDKPHFYETLERVDPDLTRVLALDKQYDEVLREEDDTQAPQIAAR